MASVFGTRVPINGGTFEVTRAPEPHRDLRIGRITPIDPSITTLPAFMAAHGHVPIPIYVNAHRAPDHADEHDYQNAYASVPGSVACPTAGLHLTPDRLHALRQAGHEVREVTLHIGYGTWKSLTSTYVDDHVMEAEHCSINTDTLTALRQARAVGRPIVAVGTSTVRTLETFASAILDHDGAGPLSTRSRLYISPGHDFRVVTCMFTNFAYPQTPIMAMTTAFAGSWPS